MNTQLLNEYAIGAYVIQRANAAIVCDRCGLVVPENSPAVRVYPWDVRASNRCFSCALDCNVFELRYALREDASRFEGRDAVERALDERLAAMVARAQGLPFECAPARDPQGRPRVRALIHGLAVDATRVTGKSFWAELRARCAFASARREYAFHVPGGDDSMRSSDPAQPLVAYVYGLNARPADNITQANDDRTLRTCFARGFPPPLLWLQGVSEKSARDKHVPRARELVERAGFNADACPVLCSKSMDRAAIEALVDALDEHFSGEEIAAIAANKSKQA